jgi:ABC-type Fe3+/spermidine/putrescine transport system ATPase subunit
MDNGDAAFDVELRGVTKNYGAFRAVDDFSLGVRRGSFTTLLGPSGCGKTTLLRIIAGFFDCDGGELLIGGKDQRGIPPEKRSTGIVFQDYALFPHMTAAENLAYGLRVRGLGPEARRDEVRRTAESLGLEELLNRFPGELSGGQQQRLALGRAVILRPRILLMDEPLSSLDAKLRVRVREELKDIQQGLGITTIYVTHDQEEALSLSDYIAVMNRGRLEQAGTPREVYNFPRTAFAADFTGPANFIEAGGKRYLVRPEWLELREGGAAEEGGAAPRFLLRGTVSGEDYFGRVTRVRVRLDGGEAAFVTADVPAALPAALPSALPGAAESAVEPGGDGRFRPGAAVKMAARAAWELPVLKPPDPLLDLK